MKHSEIRQFKLTTGNELVCEVVEWPDEDDTDVIVRNVLEIVSGRAVSSLTPEGYSFYTFRPWMTMQEGDSILLTLNINHIVGEAIPSKKLVEYYLKVVKQTNEVIENETMPETPEDYVNDVLSQIKQSIKTTDSDSTLNVISFPGSKDKIH